MKKFALIFLLVNLLSSCTHGERVDMSEIYTPAKGNEYFLPDIPNWLNFVESENCRRDEKTSYFDFLKLANSFRTTYVENIKWQWLYNKMKRENKEEKTLELFYQSYDIVKKTKNLFRLPPYPSLAILKLKGDIKQKPSSKLTSFIQSQLSEKGIPLIISSCYSTKELESWGKNLEDVWFLGQEFFSLFDLNNHLQTRWSTYFKEVFSDKKIFEFERSN